MNRYFWFCSLLALLLLTPGPRAIATESVTFDGAWWNDASHDEQLYAIQGAMDAYEDGFSDGVIRAGSLFDKSAAAMRMLSSDGPTFSRTFGYYVSGVTNFYSDHPSASRATIGLVVSCLADKPFYSCDQVAKFPSATGSGP
jgi:hypothetical protein